jgi:protein-disulfide isomerase
MRSILNVTAVLLMLALAACGGSPTSTATPAPTAAPLSPAPATPSGDRYAALPQDTTTQGFPQLGYPSATVDVVIYAAFDDPASGAFYRDSFPALLDRVRTGEIRLIFVPLIKGTIPGGRGAARAALCAGDQGAFWRYHDQLFEWQTQFPDEPFAGDRLLAGGTTAAINVTEWNNCLLADRADLRLDDAQRAVDNEANFTTTPYVTVNGAPSLTDPDSLNFTITQMLRQFEQTFLATPGALDTAEAAPEMTFDPMIAATLAPLMEQTDGAPPPLEIDLPEGWGRAYSTIVLQDIDAVRNVPFAIYQGAVTGGTGTIIVLWAFPNLMPAGNPLLQGTPVAPDLYLDGTRLLRLAVIEERCNIGTDLRREYSIGGLTALGTSFAAVMCPEQPDTRGWFAGLQQFNLNFLFYVYTDPITAMDAAQSELQAILDTVRFVLPEATAAP